MNLADLGLLLDFHYWARDRLLDALEPLTADQFTRDMESSFHSIRDTVVHIYSAEFTWYSRWVGHSPNAHIATAAFPDVASVRSTWAELEASVRAFFATRDENNKHDVFGYTTFNGQPASSIFWHMAQHVVNHATYHRGQVTTMLRQVGATPPKSLDLITFYRERGV